MHVDIRVEEDGSPVLLPVIRLHMDEMLAGSAEGQILSNLDALIHLRLGGDRHEDQHHPHQHDC